MRAKYKGGLLSRFDMQVLSLTDDSCRTPCNVFSSLLPQPTITSEQLLDSHWFAQ